MTLSHIISAALVGLGATLFMDVWGLLQSRLLGQPSSNFCMVGRWVMHMPQGRFRHEHIGRAAEKPGECGLGWTLHYLIGALFALALVALVSSQWLQQPTLLPALLFGLATVSIPYFVMQPAFGFGVASARTPAPWQARRKSLQNHLVFGLGLYVSALPLSLIV